MISRGSMLQELGAPVKRKWVEGGLAPSLAATRESLEHLVSTMSPDAGAARQTGADPARHAIKGPTRRARGPNAPEDRRPRALTLGNARPAPRA